MSCYQRQHRAIYHAGLKLQLKSVLYLPFNQSIRPPKFAYPRVITLPPSYANFKLIKEAKKNIGQAV